MRFFALAVNSVGNNNLATIGCGIKINIIFFSLFSSFKIQKNGFLHWDCRINRLHITNYGTRVLNVGLIRDDMSNKYNRCT